MTYWETFADIIKDVEGDIVECGVGRGGSLRIISKLFPDRDIYGYDSFEGFPEPTIQDKSPRNPKKGEWKHSKDYVYGALSAEGIKNVMLIKGFFDDSLGSRCYPIALLHLDADLYQSHKDPLYFLYDSVVSGGIIVFDDVFRDKKDRPFPGAHTATKEFFGSSSSLRKWCRMRPASHMPEPAMMIIGSGA